MYIEGDVLDGQPNSGRPPVKIAGVDASGNVQTVLVGSDGALQTSGGGGGTVAQGAGAAATAPWAIRLSDGAAFYVGAKEHVTAADPHATRLTDGSSFYKATTPADTQPVSGTFWQATQPISAASLPLPTGAATETTVAQGATLASQTGPLAMAVASDAPSSYVDNTINPLTMTPEGRLRVSTHLADADRVWSVSDPWQQSSQWGKIGALSYV